MHGTTIGNRAIVSELAKIGDDCKIHDDVFIDGDVTIGNRCKIQRGVYIFAGAVIEDGVFIGPRTVILNDRLPRAINPDGTLKTRADWKISGVTIRFGAAIGGGATLCPGVTIGRWAMVGAGSVVPKNVGDHHLVVGNPARLVGYVDSAGNRIEVMPPK